MSDIRKALENENVSEDMIKKVLKELGIKENKKPELYYCYCIPMRLWIIDSFYDGTKRAETKEWWDKFIGKDTESFKLVEANDEDKTK